MCTSQSAASGSPQTYHEILMPSPLFTQAALCLEVKCSSLDYFMFINKEDHNIFKAQKRWHSIFVIFSYEFVWSWKYLDTYRFRGGFESSNGVRGSASWLVRQSQIRLVTVVTDKLHLVNIRQSITMICTWRPGWLLNRLISDLKQHQSILELWKTEMPQYAACLCQHRPCLSHWTAKTSVPEMVLHITQMLSLSVVILYI